MFEPGCFIRGSVGARCGKRCEVEFEFERVFKFELEWPRLFSNIFFTFFSIFFDRFSLFFDVETQQKKNGNGCVESFNGYQTLSCVGEMHRKMQILLQL